METKFTQAKARASQLAERTFEAIQAAKKTIHYARNVRQHAMLLRSLSKLLRKRG